MSKPPWSIWDKPTPPSDTPTPTHRVTTDPPMGEMMVCVYLRLSQVMSQEVAYSLTRDWMITVQNTYTEIEKHKLTLQHQALLMTPNLMVH